MADPIIVIGSGPAGCVAARTLADRGVEVVMLEAGPGPNRPPALDDVNHLRSADATEWWWPGLPRRGRGVGGGSAVNGMVLSGLDPRDTSDWGWADAALHQEVVLDRFPQQLVSPGPLTAALAESAGFVPGEPTAVSGSVGWSPLSLAIADDRRWSVADAFLADRPANLGLRSGNEVERIDGTEVTIATGERLVGSAIVLAAGAAGSPALLLRSGLISEKEVEAPRNHPSATLVVELAAGLRVGEPGPPSSYLLRMATELAAPGTVDCQVLVLDHTGTSRAGHRHGAVIVSALESDRVDVLAEGLRHMEDLLVSLPGVLSVSTSDTPTPVEHQCCTLTGALEAGNRVPGAPGVFAVDAAALPGLPHTNTMVPVMVGARRWADSFEPGEIG